MFGGGVRLWGSNAMWWTAVLLEKRRVGEMAAAHGISRFWLYKLLTRFREGGSARESNSRAVGPQEYWLGINSARARSAP
jgi:hypothetical protein